MSNNRSYQAKEFNLSALNGISDRTPEMRFKLLRVETILSEGSDPWETEKEQSSAVKATC